MKLFPLSIFLSLLLFPTPPPGNPVCNNTLSNTNPDYTGKYRRIETYIPDENTPVKTIEVNFNVFSLPDTKENRDAFKKVYRIHAR